MKQGPLILGISLCGAGLLLGIVARHLADGRRPAPFVSREIHNSFATTSEKSPTPPLRSADTLETLAGLDDGERYGRLAAWLIDADAVEIAAFWESYVPLKDRSNDVIDLVFIHWTRLDPQAAIASVAGTPDEHHAWWAWACKDPAKALAAAVGTDHVKSVAWGIGEFHPAWMRQHFDEIPESARGSALSGLRKWGDGENPEAMLKFNKEHGLELDDASYKALIDTDPWAALDWARENDRPGSRDSGDIGSFISRMAEENPEGLALIAEQAPSGEARRMMEAAVFENLLKTDPSAAMEQAKNTDVPRTAAERLAAVGMSLVKTDPEQAFEMADRLLTVFPDAMMLMNTIQIPNGRGGGWGTAVPGVSELMDSLLFQDPAKLMDIVSSIRSNTPKSDYAFEKLSDRWVEQDVAAYAEWVKKLSDPDARSRAITKVVSQLQHDGQYRDAADWSLGITGSNRINDLQFMFNNWGQKNLPEAREWLESADLPADEKPRISNAFGP